MTSPRDRILGRIRDGVSHRPHAIHPGPFGAWRPEPPLESLSDESRLARFEELFASAGGEVVRRENVTRAAEWLDDFASDFSSVSYGIGVPEALRSARPAVDPVAATLGVSMAQGAIAETGSLVMNARDGRRAQLLVPNHVILVDRRTVYATVASALSVVQNDLPSAVGLHSGPSKSADIGQIMVKGVHGPGRVVAVMVADMQG